MAKLGQTVKTFIKVTTTDTWLGGESSSNLNLTAAIETVTDKSSDWQQGVYGIKSGTLEVTVFADKDDSAQKAAIDAFFEGATVDVIQGETDDTTTAPTSGYKGKALVNSISLPSEVGSVRSMTLGLTFTGAVTKL